MGRREGSGRVVIVGKVLDRPALARVAVEGVAEIRVAGVGAAPPLRAHAGEVKSHAVLLVGVAAAVRAILGVGIVVKDRVAVVAPVDDGEVLEVGPAAAAVEGAGISAVPVISYPPAIRAVGV